MHTCRIETACLVSSSAEKALAVLVGAKLTMNQQYAIAIEKENSL